MAETQNLEVLYYVLMRRVFWNVTPWNLVDIYHLPSNNAKKISKTVVLKFSAVDILNLMWYFGLQRRLLSKTVSNLTQESHTLKKTAPGLSETLITIYENTLRHNPKDRNLKYHSHINLKSQSIYGLVGNCHES